MRTKVSQQRTTFKNFLRGTVWAILMRWSIRGIGLISIVILARLLTPEDFGIVAMGALVIGFIKGFSELGTHMLLIREREVTREHCDTAWTVKIMQGAFVALMIVILAPFAASYFDEKKVVTVMYLLALSAFIEGTESIGMTLVRKELDFARDFRFHVYKRIVQFAVTIPLAVMLKSYWALVIGQLMTTVFGVTLSFVMHSYRPRISLARVREYLSFSLSIIPLKIGRFLNNKADVVVVGGIASTAQMGAYNVASELAAMFTKELEIPLARGLMPNYAKLAHNPQELASAFRHVLSTVAMICCAAGFGLWVVAEDFVTVILGSQWLSAIPIVKWLAIFGTLSSLLHLMGGQILIVTGREKVSAALIWMRLIVLIPSVIVAGILWGMEAVAPATAVAAALAFPVVVYYLTKSIPITLAAVAQALWRPVVAGIIMVNIVQLLHMDSLNVPVLSLVLDVSCGAISYTIMLAGLWWLAGRPQGIEQVAFHYFSSRFGRGSPA